MGDEGDKSDKGVDGEEEEGKEGKEGKEGEDDSDGNSVMLSYLGWIMTFSLGSLLLLAWGGLYTEDMIGLLYGMCCCFLSTGFVSIF